MDRENIAFTILNKLCQLLAAGAFNNHTDVKCYYVLLPSGVQLIWKIIQYSFRVTCIAFSKDSCTFHLHSSKTGPCCQGVPVVIIVNSVLCLVASMPKFVSCRQDQAVSTSSP